MGSTHVEAAPPRDIAKEGEDTLAAQIRLAPEQFQATATYAPQYAQLYQDMLGQNAPQLQDLQSRLNTAQRQADITDVANLGPQAIAAYRAANPGLSQIQDAFTQRALNAQAPISMLGAPDQITAQTSTGLSPYERVSSGTIRPDSVRTKDVQSGLVEAQQLGPGSYGNSQVGANLIGADQVWGQQNIGSQALLGNTLGELAKGGSLSRNETLGITDSVLNRFNMAGRANDPSAIAETALGLDAAQQARLAQRQGAVANASGLYQQDINSQQQARLANQATGLSAAQSNQDALLRAALANQGTGLQAGLANQEAALRAGLANQSTGLQAGLANQSSDLQAQLANMNAGMQAGQYNQDAALRAALANQAAGLQQQQLWSSMSQADMARNLAAQQSNQQYNYMTGAANQQAQLANANYLNQLLAGAGQFNAMTAQDPYSLILGRSAAPQQAQAGTAYQGGMFDPFSAYGADVANSNFNALNAANIATANNNAGLWGAGIGAAGSVLGGFLCWVAREVYGAENPRWVVFRDWMLTKAPAQLRENYIAHGARLAELIRFRPEIKAVLREFMDTKIEEEMAT